MHVPLRKPLIYRVCTKREESSPNCTTALTIPTTTWEWEIKCVREVDKGERAGVYCCRPVAIAIVGARKRKYRKHGKID